MSPIVINIPTTNSTEAINTPSYENGENGDGSCSVDIIVLVIVDDNVVEEVTFSVLVVVTSGNVLVDICVIVEVEVNVEIELILNVDVNVVFNVIVEVLFKVIVNVVVDVVVEVIVVFVGLITNNSRNITIISVESESPASVATILYVPNGNLVVSVRGQTNTSDMIKAPFSSVLA